MGKSFRYDRDDYEEVEYNKKREKFRRNNRKIKSQQKNSFIDYSEDDENEMMENKKYKNS